MGDRKAPTPLPANQLKPDPPPAPPSKRTIHDLALALDNREFCYMEMALLELEKSRSARLQQHLRAALDQLGSYGDNSSYYFKRGLEATMAAEEKEHGERVAERRKMYEDTKGQR